MSDHRISHAANGLFDTLKDAARTAATEVKKDVNLVATKVKREVGAELGELRNDVKSEAQALGDVARRADAFVQGEAKALKLPKISTDDLLNVGRDVLGALFPQHTEDPRGQQYLQGTQDFRTTVATAQGLQKKLSGMTPADPKYAETKKALDATTAHLSQAYGYTVETAPKPGAVWVDPGLMERTLPGVTFNSKNFPTGKPVTTPPNPMDVVFMNGRSFSLTDADGKATVVKTPEEYKAAIAKNRAALGSPRTDGDPIAVHVSFEGGGGKGKRYGPAIAEMYRNGVVPASISGTSAGAIAAGLVAAGADPGEIDRFMKSGDLSKLYDVDLKNVNGGVMDGKAAYDLFDQELRKLTGIKDRPVTFADLKIPLQIVSTKMSDTQPPKGQEDLTQVKNRIFVFSQETTPDTPVALAMRASMSIPAAFDPVKMVDPSTGRAVTLVDGGVLDNLPMGYNHNNLPVVGLSLASRDDNHPATHQAAPKPLPGGNLDVTHLLWNALNGYTLMKEGAGDANDFKDRTQPPAGDFMVSLPTWDLTHPDQGDTVLGFGYDPKLDPKLDTQTRGVMQNFLRQYLGDFGKPGAKGTNAPTTLPPNLAFTQDVQAAGKTFQARYQGGDVVTFTSGKDSYDLHIGKQKIEAMWLDGQAFGDLSAQLGKPLEDYLKWAQTSGAWFDV